MGQIGERARGRGRREKVPGLLSGTEQGPETRDPRTTAESFRTGERGLGVPGADCR